MNGFHYDENKYELVTQKDLTKSQASNMDFYFKHHEDNYSKIDTYNYENNRIYFKFSVNGFEMDMYSDCVIRDDEVVLIKFGTPDWTPLLKLKENDTTNESKSGGSRKKRKGKSKSKRRKSKQRKSKKSHRKRK